MFYPRAKTPVPTTVPHKNSINKGVDTFEIAMNLQLRKLIMQDKVPLKAFLSTEGDPRRSAATIEVQKFIYLLPNWGK